MPCEWMNARTAALFAAYSPASGGGFIEERTTTADPKMTTPGIADACVVVQMAKWNQYQYGDPRFPVAPDIVHSKFIQGDYDPTTIPGRDSTGNKTENGSGITKFTDLTENFSQSTVRSSNDGFLVGSLLWNDSLNALYAAEHASEWVKVYVAYIAGEPPIGVKSETGVASVFSLAQNYPNPFNPSTEISFSVPSNNEQTVTVKVYNVLGQEVVLLYSGLKIGGSYSVHFDGSKFGSGVYFYRLQSGSTFITRKMILLK